MHLVPTISLKKEGSIITKHIHPAIKIVHPAFGYGSQFFISLCCSAELAATVQLTCGAKLPEMVKCRTGVVLLAFLPVHILFIF